MTIKHLCASLIMWASVFLFAPSQANSTPTYCEFVIVEYQAALDRGDISKKEYRRLVKKCQRFEQRR